MKLPLQHRAARSAAAKRGVILPAVVSMLAILGVLLMSLLGGSVEQKQWSDGQEYDSRVEAIADTAIALAANRIWTDFEAFAGPNGMHPWNFRTYMEGLGITDQAGVTMPAAQSFLAAANLSQDGEGHYPMSGGYITDIGIVRVDSLDSTRITISARASMNPVNTPGRDNNQATVQQTFEVTRPDWQGMDYALLANNVNCILCHAEIDDAERFYNQDPLAQNSFDRVRVGSLESIHIRSNPNSKIAGTLYLGGEALEADGDPLTNWGSLNLQSAAFGSDAKLIEDGFGNLSWGSFEPADATEPEAGENLYLDYLANGDEGQVDGALPGYFPSPFPDNGGYDPATGVATPGLADNRVLDRNEFLASAQAAIGSLSGGRSAVVPEGTVLNDLGELDSALDAGNLGIGGVTTGNVILHGTKANPIVLDGTVAIDGDLIISGYVKGQGSLMASGNVFIPGDLLYEDGTNGDGQRTYGVSSDGALNSLALTAGGNVTIGDPSHGPYWNPGSIDGTKDTGFNFIMDELAIFNRGEWIKTQPELPGKKVWVHKTKEVEVMVTPMREEVYYEDVDVYEWQATGNMVTNDVYDWVQTGTKTVDEYDYIHHPADPPEPYGSPWTEKVWKGSHEEPIMEWQVVGTESVPEMVYAYVRTDSVERTRDVPDGDPYPEMQTVDDSEWVVPMHPNPLYEGEDYIARYYAYGDETPVPIYNKGGYFDPDTKLWHSPERAENWTNGRLTVADQTDPNDPMLFDASGQPIAVVETVLPKGGWVGNELLAALVDRELAGRDEDKPLEIDATMYSSNSIFGMVPGRNQEGVDGKMIVNGALVAADIGLLAPKGIQVNYDKRNRDLIRVRDDRKLSMRRSLWAPAARP